MRVFLTFVPHAGKAGALMGTYTVDRDMDVSNEGAREVMMPDFVVESSWEVCNKVGGIYTVLSTRAKVLGQKLGGNLLFVGPDLGQGGDDSSFEADERMFAEWVTEARRQGLRVRTGRWRVPGRPAVALVDFHPYYAVKDDIYGAMWTEYQVNSLHAYGDYDEASMFAYGAGRVVESFYNHYLRREDKRVVYQAHEWMSGMGALYVRTHVPQVATIFTTHATSIGRSIAGNGKPLYDCLYAYNGNQMAGELNMEAKHSIERQTAHYVDCFTTVSDLTARECNQLLDRRTDAVLLNGFENDFLPPAASFASTRSRARKRLLKVANALTGCRYGEDTLIVTTSGRYEYKNKGIDVVIDAMARLREREGLKGEVLCLIMVPGWVAGARADLVGRLRGKVVWDTPLANPVVTHDLHEQQGDTILNALSWYGLANGKGDAVKVVLIPSYLDGHDGIVDLSYYDTLIGSDLCLYPSYYEPWGYTPLEAAAFHIPSVTTDLSGFGLWAQKVRGGESHIEDGVEVVHRTDYNYHDVVDSVVETVLRYASLSKTSRKEAGEKAASLASQALWEHFIEYYYEAYDHALRNAEWRSRHSGTY